MGKRVHWNIILASLLIVSIIILSANVNAALEGEEAKIDKAYQCLKDRIDASPRVSFAEAVFGVMALGKYDGLFTNITKEKKSNEFCWPAAGCKLKDTAQVLLAYDRAGESTTEIEKWISNKNGTSTDLAWFVEIDTERQQPSSCTLKWDNGQGSIQIDQTAKITGNPGNCLVISSSGYLLKIRESCLEKRIDISCNNSFITTLLYQKNTGDQSDCLSQSGKTCFVIGETHSAASLGTTTEQVKASCFKTGTSCDYEGSLWATLALAQTGRDVSRYMPYILALSEDNQRLFPDAFIYTLIKDDNSYSKIVELRKAENYWEVAASPYNRFYDTSLGMIALSGFANTQEIDKTKEYLLKIQTREGCWNNNNIKDTAFILYSGWKRGAIGGGSGGSGGGTLNDCLSVANANYDCTGAVDCVAAGGQVLDNFFCSGISKCCSVRVPLKSCTELGGSVCGTGKQCSQGTLPSLNGACCTGGGTCEDAIPEDTCASRDGTCRSSCSDDEDELSYSCSGASVCCVAKSSSSSGGGFGAVTISLLILLIILVILAIIYRHKIEMWWFTYKKNRQAGKGGASASSGRPGPGFPPRPSMTGPTTGFSRPLARRPMPPVRSAVPRPAAPKPAPRVTARGNAGKNKELEDTLKKLRDMSK